MSVHERSNPELRAPRHCEERSNPEKIRFYCLILLLTTSLSTCYQQKAEPVAMPEKPGNWAKMLQERYEIYFPPDWELQSNVAGVEFVLLSKKSSPQDRFRENINLTIEPLADELTLDNYAALTAKRLGDKYKIRERKKFSADGQEFFRAIFDAPDNLRIAQNYYIKGRTAYILTFTFDPNEKAEILDKGNKIVIFFRIL